MRKLFIPIFIVFVFSLGWSSSGNAATYWVINTNDAGPGSFREAVLNAGLGDTVRLDSSLLVNGSDTIHLSGTVFMSAPLVFKGVYSDADSIYISGEGIVSPLTSAWFGTQFQGENIVLDSMFFINSGSSGGTSVSAFSTVFVDTLRVFNSAFIFNDAGANGFGAAIKAENINVLHIDNSKFQNNIAGLEYSSIYCSGKDMIIQQSSFTHGDIYQSSSSLSDGYTIYFDALDDTVTVDLLNIIFHHNDGGGIWVDANGYLDLTVENVTMDSNNCDGYDLLKATSNGFSVDADALLMRGNTNATNMLEVNGSATDTTFIMNALFEDNSSSLSTVSVSGHIGMENSDFFSNQATATNGDGGALSARRTEVSSSSFIGNSCGDKGGAIYSTHEVVVSSSTFISNSTDESSFANGGAVYCFGNFSAVQSTFQGNRAYDGGVVKSLGDSIAFVSCFVDSNRSINSGGVAHLIWNDSSSGAIRVDSSQFTHNRALESGGVLYLESGASTSINSLITASTFHKNQCWDNGGAVWLDADVLDLDLHDVEFTENRDTAGDGAALAIRGNGSTTLYLEDVEFFKNGGSSNAAAMGCVHGGLQSVTLKEVVADSNTSAGVVISGSANPVVDITGVSATGNLRGAMILILPNVTGFVHVDSSTFIGNEVFSEGAGIRSDTRLRVSNSSFVGNLCQSVTNLVAGGGINAKGTLVLEHCTFDDNVAINGAGINADGVDSLHLFEVSFSNNQGTLRGGAIRVEDVTQGVEISDCTFLSNEAEQGGAIYLDLDIDASVSSSTFRNNHATEDGGGIYGESITPVSWIFNDSIKFIDNSADRDGGAVALRHVTTNTGNILVHARFDDARLDSNTAGRNGGAVALSAFQSFINTPTDHAKGVLEIKRSSLAHNEVTGTFPQFMSGSGGAVAMLGSDTLMLEVDSSHLSWNEAYERGGAVYMRASRSNIGKPSFAKASIDATTLDHNEAQITGSAMAVIAFHDAGTNVPTVALADIEVYRSTVVHNSDPVFGSALFTSAGNGSAFPGDKNKIARTRLEASTVAFNTGAASTTEILNWSGFYSSASTTCKSSLVGMNGDSSFVSTIGPAMISQGYNAFDASVSNYSLQLDLHDLDSIDFDLGPLQMNGGSTPTMMPGDSSLVVNGGDPQNLDPAQNGGILYQRDRGAAESNGCQYFSPAYLEECDSVYWAPADTTFYTSITDTFYFPSTLNCDSTVVLNVDLGNTTFISETVDTCGPFEWMKTGLTYDSSGIYRDTVSSVNSCDSIFTLTLTILTLDTGINTIPGGLKSNQAQATYQWIDCATDAVLLGQEEQSFFPTASGSYKVALEWQGCVDTTDCYNVVGLAESKASSIAVFPNPFGSSFQVLQDGPRPMHLEVFDALGALVHRTSISSEIHTVNASEWPVGVYSLVFMDSSGSREIQRLVKR